MTDPCLFFSCRGSCGRRGIWSHWQVSIGHSGECKVSLTVATELLPLDVHVCLFCVHKLHSCVCVCVCVCVPTSLQCSLSPPLPPRNLALGIGIQNFPEGLAVSLPLRAAGMGLWKSFWWEPLH